MNFATSTDPINRVSAKQRPRLMAFEMEVEGHHPGYIQNFAQSWLDFRVDANLDFVVTPRFYTLHSDVAKFVAELDPDRISIRAINSDESHTMEQVSYLRYFPAWKLFCKYARQLEADHGLVMYFDFFQLPSVLGESPPCPFSAMYFRPTFHYHTFQKYEQSIREWVRAKRKKLLLKRTLKNKKLATLYCLDEIAVEYIRDRFRPDCSVRHIADSFCRHPRNEVKELEYRQQLAIEPGRRVFCLLGVLDQRKGVKELLQALPLVPADAAKKICILLLGRVQPSQRDEIHERVRALQQGLSMQIVLHDDWIPGDQVQHYYELSDVILATYQRHMGSSSALIRSALSAKPVLSSDYGLMGEIVHRRRLGLTVDTRRPAAVAGRLAELAECDLDQIIDRQEALRYAEENSPRQLAEDLSLLVR